MSSVNPNRKKWSIPSDATDSPSIPQILPQNEEDSFEENLTAASLSQQQQQSHSSTTEADDDDTNEHAIGISDLDEAMENNASNKGPKVNASLPSWLNKKHTHQQEDENTPLNQTYHFASSSSVSSTSAADRDNNNQNQSDSSTTATASSRHPHRSRSTTPTRRQPVNRSPNTTNAKSTSYASSSSKQQPQSSNNSSSSNLHRKNLEYIKSLESKKVAMRKKKDELREKERGFQLYLNGANNETTAKRGRRKTSGGSLSQTMNSARSQSNNTNPRYSNSPRDTSQSTNLASTSTGVSSKPKRPRPRYPNERRQRKNWNIKPIADLQQQEISQLRQSISEWKKQKRTSMDQQDDTSDNDESVNQNEHEEDEGNELLKSMQQSLDSDLMSKIMGKLKKLNKGKQKQLLDILSGMADEGEEEPDFSDDDQEEEEPHTSSEEFTTPHKEHDSKTFSMEDFDEDEFQDDFDSFHGDTSGFEDDFPSQTTPMKELIRGQSPNFAATSPMPATNKTSPREDVDSTLVPEQADSPVTQTKNPLLNALRKTREESKVNMWLAHGSSNKSLTQSSEHQQQQHHEDLSQTLQAEHLRKGSSRQEGDDLSFSVHHNWKPQQQYSDTYTSAESREPDESKNSMSEFEKKILERPPSTAKRHRSPNPSNTSRSQRIPTANTDASQNSQSESEKPVLSLRARRLARKRAKAQYNAQKLLNPTARYSVANPKEGNLSATTGAINDVTVNESFDSLMRFKMNNLSRLFGKDDANDSSADNDAYRHRAKRRTGSSAQRSTTSSHSYALNLQNPTLDEDSSLSNKDNVNLASTYHHVSKHSTSSESPPSPSGGGYRPSSISGKRPRGMRASYTEGMRSASRGQRPSSKEISSALSSSREAPTQQSQSSPTKQKPSQFVIPTLPRGSRLSIDILTTWGDVHYVGLSGLEIFDKFGHLIELKDIRKQVSADPPDINCLPQYSNDPRVVYNLFDGINKTCDDMHTWLAPYEKGRKHNISIQLNGETTIGMIRIWNYNKSRIHSYRGARHIQVHLDKYLIFDGEIRRAPGTLDHAEQYAEHILYTNSQDAIQNIEEYDEENYSFDDDLAAGEDPRASISMDRPTTRGGGSHESNRNSQVPSFKNMDPDMRPLTAATTQIAQEDRASDWDSQMRASSSMAGSLTREGLSPNEKFIEAQELKLHLLESWGDRHYIGLTGIEVLDENMKPVELSMKHLSAVPQDMNSINGHSGDYRTLDKLLNGKNMTQNDRNMWLIPSSLENDPHIVIDLGEKKKLCGIRIYNYNKSEEDTARGVKKLLIDADGKKLDEYDVRKAPGHAKFDFGHTILFVAGNTSSAGESGDQGSQVRHASSIYQPDVLKAIKNMQSTKLPTPAQDCQTPLLPVGYVFKFRFISTYGDFHYIGLNGLELYDARHQKITLSAENLKASPDSVQKEVAGCENDQRTLDKLIDGVNVTWDDRHMFLSPYTVGKFNEVYIIFSDPVALSCIKLWNYSKTPSRGIEEFEIYADNTLFYKGFMRKAPGAGGFNTSSFSQSILFTNDKSFIAKEYKNVYSRRGQDNHVGLWNDGQPLARGEFGQRRHNTNDSEVRPKTMMTHLKRGGM